jgi:MarR family transcriptional regulator, lower aerobic nicotinate degradation pathway regulator
MPLPAMEQDAFPLDGYDIDAQVGFLLRRAHQRHTALFQERMAPLDLTPTQFNALIRVVELGSVTQNQLGRLSAMDPATIQGVVRRLEDRGLVHRRPDPGDRRATLLTATPDGTALAAQAVARGHAITAATLAPLTPIERLRLLDLLRKLG